MVPAAPARFSTTTAWPRISASGCAIKRAEISVPPPALAPTTRRMGRVGQSWAPVEPMLAPTIAIAATETRMPSEAAPAVRSLASNSCAAGPLLGIGSSPPKCRPKRDSQKGCPKNSAFDDDEPSGLTALVSRVSLVDGASAQMAIRNTGYERV